MAGRNDDRGGDAGDAAGGEVAMSIEETNKLRISLGLKPLQETVDTDQAAKDEHKKRKRAEEDAANTADLEERVRSTRERRKQQELLAKTKTLGEAEPEVDDVMAWVNKSRKVQETTKTEATANSRRSTRTKNVDNDNEEEDDTDALAGAKVKFGVDDLEAGEEMILTLEDRGILDDKGQLIDDEDLALENVLKREDKQRAKAFADSRKTAKPLWEEDGQKRSILDKYDQEEEEAFLLDDAGAIEASKMKRQDDIRAKLAAAKANGGVSGALEANIGASLPGTGGNSDYYTPEEMAAMRKPKKKKERKLKKKALTSDELAALEDAAAAAGGDGDLGSRADRERRAAEKSAALVNVDQERRARFDAALNKANYASLALKNEQEGGDNEEEDEDLYRSLQKARELAAKKIQQEDGGGGASLGGVERGGAVATNQFIQRRENGAVNGAGTLPGGLTFTDIGEFTRGITVKEENGAVPVKIAPDALESFAAAAVKKENNNNDDEMTKIEEERDMQTAVPMEEDQKPPAGVSKDGAWGNWMPAAEAEAAAAAAADVTDQKTTKRSYRRNRATDEDDTDRPKNDSTTNTTTADAAAGSMGSEKTIGSGLAGALAFLKERGELKQPVEWAGRTNDHRDSYFTKAMGNLEDVYSGGRSEDRLALDVEVALTKKDEFGRILTPKEAFRQLCHDFHGIKPSRNSKEKRAKQIAKELAQRKAATGDAGGTLEGLKAVQTAAATPYMVLSGTVRPGQSRDATSGYATVERGQGSFNAGIGSVPRLGGHQGPPLTGKAKVEAMLGMAPPPPRPPQQHQQGHLKGNKK